MYMYGYYPLALAVVLGTALNLTPRAKRDTFGEGAERAWFYIAIWTVVPTQVINWAAWRMGKYMDLAPLPLARTQVGRVPGLDHVLLSAGVCLEVAAHAEVLHGSGRGGSVGSKIACDWGSLWTIISVDGFAQDATGDW